MTETLAIIPQGVLDLIESRRTSAAWRELDDMDLALAKLPQADFKVRHVFTPGLCVRELMIPAGTLVTSRIHLFEHPFIISLGIVSVWSDECRWEIMAAPHTGVTLPATRRAVYAHEDTIWSTLHATNETDPDKILAAGTYNHLKLGHLSAIPADQTTKELT